MTSVYAVILAAGKGTRMKSDLHKVLHPIGGKAMLEHLLDTLLDVGIDETYLVIGHGAETVQSKIGERVKYCFQAEQLGTGHAVMQAEPVLKEKDGITLVINGDTPLITKETMTKLIARHQQSGAAATLLTTNLEDPSGYGRIKYDTHGNVLAIVEEKDASPEEKQIKEINVGFYAFDNRKLFSKLHRISNNNAQGEYYFTEIFDILRKDGEQVVTYLTEDAEETVSINDRIALAKAEEVLRRRINEMHMRNGVTLQDPERTYIEPGVEIGPDTVILAGCQIRGKTTIGKGCVIGPDTDLSDARIGDRVRIIRSVIVESDIDNDVTIGPFAHLRPGSKVGKEAKIGDFVEIKNSVIGDGSKVPHLSYIGDAEIGKGVNMGCGSIIVNYDGVKKHKTIVEDGAFVGCNSNLIAPVRVGKDAYVAAGSTIHLDVPAGAFAIARERQTNKEDYAKKIKEKRNSSH
jgi:bifunctional UDP-N-acetylglucosamine pyrophosphorylase/glucosamine-1-phosphate N-acetyltransferase